MLEFFAFQKSQNAPYIYKTLVFFLIELHEEEHIRQTLLEQFGQTFQSLYQIPVQLLLNPLIRQIQEGYNKSYHLNLFDIEFFKISVGHPQISPQMVMMIYEYFFKIFAKDIRWSASLLDLFGLCYNFHKQDELFLHRLMQLINSLL